jgi:folate-dependent phosphoribosylglycinamide formyltransferase PurN
MINYPKLKVGILSNDMLSPVWVTDALKELEKDGIVELKLIVIKDSNKRTYSKNKYVRFINGEYLLFRIYYIIDKYLANLKKHPFEKVNFKDIFPNMEILIAKTHESSFREYFEEETLNMIDNYDLDFILCRGFKILTGDILNKSKFGVLSFHHGDNLVNRGSPTLFWEMRQGEKKAGQIFQQLNEELDNGLVLEKSYTGIKSISFSKNLNAHYWKSTRILIRAITKLHLYGQEYIDSKKNLTSQKELIFYNYPIYKHPGNAVMIKFLTALVYDNIARKIKGKFIKNEIWRIMIAINNNNEVEKSLWRYKYIDIPTKGDVADPFVVYKDNKYIIYFEEWHQIRKGFISCVEIDQKGNVINYYPKVISSDYHYSFPSTYEEDGQLYIIPETSDACKIEIYLCEKFPDKFSLYAEILVGKTCYDPHIYKKDGIYYLFVNIKEHESISSYEECFLYTSINIKGPWIQHRQSPIMSDVSNARPAGSILNLNGELYRISQNCEIRYGYSITFNKIIKINENEYKEEKTSEILPFFKKNIIGVHTYNYSNGCNVIDVCVRK